MMLTLPGRTHEDGKWREQARQQVRALALDGMACGPGPELDDTYFARLRERSRDIPAQFSEI